MAANLCPNCGTPKITPDERVCRSCGLSFSSVAAYFERGGFMSAVSTRQTTLVTFFAVVAAIAFGWLLIEVGFSFESLFASFAVVAGFWYGILRLAQVQAPRVSLETCILGIVFLIMPFYVAATIFLVVSSEDVNVLLATLGVTCVMVVLGSLIGIFLATLFASWNVLRRDTLRPQSSPLPRAIFTVYGSLFVFLLIEFWIFSRIPRNAELEGIWYFLAVFVIALIGCIIFPIIGRRMASRSLPRP